MQNSTTEVSIFHHKGIIQLILYIMPQIIVPENPVQFINFRLYEIKMGKNLPFYRL